MHIKRIKIALLAALASGASLGAAQAATLVYTQTVAPTAGPNDYVVPFSQFDPTLGTLTSAELKVNATAAGYDYFENLSPDFGLSVLGFGQGHIELNMPTIDDLTAVSGWSGPVTLLSPFDGAADFSGTDSLYASGSDSTVRSDLFTDAATLNKLIGTNFLFGEVIVTTDTGLYYSAGNGQDLTYNVMSGDVSIIYTYTPNSATVTSGVPEPSSWALMLLGVGGIGAALRVGKRRNSPPLAA